MPKSLEINCAFPIISAGPLWGSAHGFRRGTGTAVARPLPVNLATNIPNRPTPVMLSQSQVENTPENLTAWVVTSVGVVHELLQVKFVGIARPQLLNSHELDFIIKPNYVYEVINK